MAAFEKLGAVVVGVSPDDIHTLIRFQREMGAPQRFVSDPPHQVIAAYQASINLGRAVTAKRITFVISKEGRIIHIVYDWSPLTNVNAVYNWLREHPQT